MRRVESGEKRIIEVMTTNNFLLISLTFLRFSSLWIGLPLVPSNKSYLIRDSGVPIPGGTYILSHSLYFRQILLDNLTIPFHSAWHLQIKLNMHHQSIVHAKVLISLILIYLSI